VFIETPVEELTEENSHAKRSCSNLLLYDICIWFSDKKSYSRYTEKNEQVG